MRSHLVLNGTLQCFCIYVSHSLDGMDLINVCSLLLPTFNSHSLFSSVVTKRTPTHAETLTFKSDSVGGFLGRISVMLNIHSDRPKI